MEAMGLRDRRALPGHHALDEAYRERVLVENLPRYALIAAPGAEFLKGLEVGLDLVDAQDRARSGRPSDARARVLQAVDDLFSLRGIPYRLTGGRFEWAGDRGLQQAVVEPELQALQDSRVAGARSEFEAAMATSVPVRRRISRTRSKKPRRPSRAHSRFSQVRRARR